MKIIGTFMLLLISVVSSAQIPQKIKVQHDSLTEYYENGINGFNYTKKVRNLQTYYDSVTEYYRCYDTKKEIIKGARFYTDNDLFSFVDNRDHEYTGGVRFELITDHFGLKLISFRKEYRYLSYQSILFGFELYTPNNINVDDIKDLDKRDRPFASFQYFGRSRNIIRYDGKYRSSENIKIGLIGGNISRNFQRIIHRDISDSENNNGWDYQVANGGRFAIQYDLENEWQYKLKNKNLFLHYGVTGKAGFERVSLTPTLAFTNKSFFQKNPHYAINSPKKHFGTQGWRQQLKQTCFFETKLETEYVIYNSLLQGYLRKNKEFIFNNATQANERIPVRTNINNLVGRLSIATGFRNYNSTVMFQYFFQTPEYNYAWKNKFFHRYGRISFTLNI